MRWIDMNGLLLLHHLDGKTIKLIKILELIIVLHAIVVVAGDSGCFVSDQLVHPFIITYTGF